MFGQGQPLTAGTPCKFATPSRARGELSTSLPHLPLSRVHLSYSDRTASLKGTFLDAHYLSTSHSSGEYEACHGVCTLRRRCS